NDLGALVPLLVPTQVPGLPRREDDQELPETIAVVEPGEPALSGATAEAIKRAERDVFFVGHAALGPLELLARQPHQALEVALPQLLRRARVAGLEFIDPARHRTFGCHR